MATSSFVVVFPLEPVIPTTGMAKRRRWAAPSRWSAAVVSSTRTTGKSASAPSPGGMRVVTAQAAPRIRAWATKAWPSWVAPRIAKNASPGRQVRLSIDTPVTSVSRRPR